MQPAQFVFSIKQIMGDIVDMNRQKLLLVEWDDTITDSTGLQALKNYWGDSVHVIHREQNEYRVKWKKSWILQDEVFRNSPAQLAAYLLMKLHQCAI